MSLKSQNWSWDFPIPVGGKGSRSAEFQRRTTELLRKTGSKHSARLSTGTLVKSSSTNISEEALHDNGTLANENLEDDHASEADLEVLRELEGDNVVVDRGDSLRANEVAAEIHRTSDDSESDEIDLKSRLEAACVEVADGKSQFLPVSELERVLSERNVRKTILASNPNIPPLLLEQLLNAIRPGAPQVLLKNPLSKKYSPS